MGLRSVTYHPTQVNASRFNSCSQALQGGTRFNYTGGIKSWVNLDGWLYTEMLKVYLFADSHPSRKSNPRPLHYTSNVPTVMGCLYDPANVQETSSKCIAGRLY